MLQIYKVSTKYRTFAPEKLFKDEKSSINDGALQMELEKGLARMVMIRFDIEHLTGKETIELVNRHGL